MAQNMYEARYGDGERFRKTKLTWLREELKRRKITAYLILDTSRHMAVVEDTREQGTTPCD